VIPLLFVILLYCLLYLTKFNGYVCMAILFKFNLYYTYSRKWFDNSRNHSLTVKCSMPTNLLHCTILTGHVCDIRTFVYVCTLFLCFLPTTHFPFPFSTPGWRATVGPAGMRAHVLLEIALDREAPAAHMTGEGPCAVLRVQVEDVDAKSRRAAERFGTDVARVRSLASVTEHVHVEAR
jgi:hypothetical protein